MRLLYAALVTALVIALPAPRPATAGFSLPYTSDGRQQVAPGVHHDWGYAEAAEGRQRVNVVEVDPSTPGIHLETSMPRSGGVGAEKINARERTTSQALFRSSEGHRVVAATNGTTFNSWPSGQISPRGLNVRNGELLTGGRSQGDGLGPILAFGVDPDGRAMIGTPVLTIELTLADGAVVPLQRVNQGPLANEAALYLPRYDTHTSVQPISPDPRITELIVETGELTLTPSSSFGGTVVGVRHGVGDAPLAARHAVVSAVGSAADLLVSVANGDNVSLTVSVDEAGRDWSNVRTAIGARELVVRDGQIEILPNRPAQIAAHHPRTALGVTAEGGVIMVTIDGRSQDSGGLDLIELGEMMLELGAVSALNLDGGGSTTMAIRKPGNVEVSIANTPSDPGGERTVANSLQVISTVSTGTLSDLVVNPSTVTLAPGNTRQMTVRGHDAAFNGVPVDPSAVNWAVTNTAAAHISASGLLTATSPAELQVTATAGDASGSASVSILDPQAGPVVSTPQVALQATGAVGKRKAPLIVSWSASSDAGSIVAVELQRRIDGGGWLNMTLPAPAPDSVVRNFKFGRRYVVRVRVTDSAGMTSPWVHSPAFTLLAYNENSQSINRSTGWTNVRSYYSVGSQFGRSATKGASVVLNYSGMQVAVIGNRGPKHGLADVHVGPSAVRVGPIDLRRSRLQLRRVLFAGQAPTNYANSASRIELRNASTGTRKRADFDAFIVLARLD
jgi:hypothetical protein